MFIILIQPIQHSSGSSPLPHLPTSCFPLLLVYLFPYSFLRLYSSSLCSPAVSYFFLDSHPFLSAIRSPVSSRCFLSNLSGDPQIFIFQPFFLHLCPSFHPTLWHPKWLRSLSFLSQLLQSLTVPFSPSRIWSVSQGPNSCISFCGLW